MYIADNLVVLRNYHKLTQVEVAQLIGIGRTTLTGYEKGEHYPTIDVAIQIATLYKVTVEALLYKPMRAMSPRQLEKFIATPDPVLSGQLLQVREVVTSVGPDNEENIELVPLRATMGYVSGGYQDEQFIASLSTFRLPLPDISRNRKYRLFPTEGESMLPIPSGAYVLGEYIEDWYSIKDGTGCVVVSTDGIVIKKITNELAAKSQLRLHSLNPAFTPYELNVSHILELWKFKLFISLDFPDAEPSLSTILGEIRQIKELVQPAR
ncbi:helix-turn-helix domain-containing protein [Spirosoma endbachense]|uniref:Helix-turn-helix domain-containing protein n=1 Tax=Spirosoma endbachense TaxID=2666025 RepID=A0A6P1W269_9BACT|nr:helix-turn-helix domain-containing protein [Spirosoma endbachense]QHV97766.1 helix-turn-helix domain-containing protein [Spirosoma endbachense]